MRDGLKSLGIHFWEALACMVFAVFAMQLAGWFRVCAAFQVLFMLGGVYKIWPMPWGVRSLVILGISIVVWLTRSQFNPQIYLFIVFQVLFLMFSQRTHHPGPVFRLSTLILLTPFVLMSLPPGIALTVSFAVTVLILSQMIAYYSGMRPRIAFWWFLKRSLRKETVFVLAMVTGLFALGLKRMNDGASLRSGVSGLSSELSPGAIQRLALSNAIAMKIQFEDPLLVNPSELYFRSTTLEEPSGFSWNAAPSRIVKTGREGADRIRYRSILSSRYAAFLPMLDVGLKAEFGGNHTTYGRSNGTFFPSKIRSSWIHYHGESSFENNLPLDNEDRMNLTAIPDGLSDEVLKLAKGLSSTGKSEDFLKAWTGYLIHNKYVYTLVPGEGATTAEDFIFAAKAGYCEHYASATALLARAAGIPARVVTGFMGGQWTADTKALLVRDLDAHAWTELWSDVAKKWVRFDPVQVIAPDRIRMGSEDWLRSIGARLPFDWDSDQSLLYQAVLLQIEELFAWMQSDILDWLVSILIRYSQEIALFGFIGILGSYLWVRRQKKTLERRSVESRMIRRLEAFLGKRHLGRERGETVLAWLDRIAHLVPSASAAFKEFSKVYAQIAYSSERKEGDLKSMKAAAEKVMKLIKTHKSSKIAQSFDLHKKDRPGVGSDSRGP